MKNKPAYKLHKLTEGFIVTSDEEIKNDTAFYLSPTNYFGKTVRKEGNLWVCENMGGFHFLSEAEKLIAQQDQIDFSALKQEDQKEIGWFDNLEDRKIVGAQQYALDKCKDKISCLTEVKVAWETGFETAQKLLSDKKWFIEEQVREAIMKGIDIWMNNMTDGSSEIIEKDFKEIIQYLSQPKSWSVELEMEWITEEDEDHDEGGTLPGTVVSYQQPKLTNGKIKVLRLL